MFIVITIYFAFVTKIGPRFMKNREPYQLRNAMVIYNFLLVGINIFFFFEALYWIDYGARLLNFRFPDGNDTSPKALYIARSFHLYYLTKIIDLFDTVFFVLRKKYNQISGKCFLLLKYWLNPVKTKYLLKYKNFAKKIYRMCLLFRSSLVPPHDRSSNRISRLLVVTANAVIRLVCCHQLLHPCGDVHLLWLICHRSANGQVLVVEEIHHHNPINTICDICCIWRGLKCL